MEETPPVNHELVQRLRTLARDGHAPVEELRYLEQSKLDKDSFTYHMMTAFDEYGEVWLVATRWWRGTISETLANRLLQPIFDDSSPWWKPDA